MLYRFALNKKVILCNLILAALIKGAFAYPVYQLRGLIGDIKSYSKEQVIQETNTFRSSLGLAVLREDATLDTAAAQKLQDMIAHQYFAHYSPEGLSPWHWFEKNKYVYSYAGENLAIGFLDAPSTVNAWIDSPSHRANLVNVHYQDIGVAVGLTTIRDIMGVIVVQLFGTPVARPTAVTSPVPIPTQKPKSITLGFSQSHAADDSEPIAAMVVLTPPVVPSSTPVLSPVRQSPIELLRVSETLPPRESAIYGQKSSEHPVSARLAGALNAVLVLYTCLMALVSGAYWFFRERVRHVLIKTAMNFAVLLFAVLVPVLHASRIAFIR